MAGTPGRRSDLYTLSGALPVLIAAALFAWFLGMAPAVAGGEVLRWAIPWVPSLDISVSFLIDGLSLSFALLITGIGALVLLYSAAYLDGHEHFSRFTLYLTLFMLSMLGLVVADNMITLFVFWELTTITSYLLIGFSHAAPDSRRSALQALLVTAAGGLALLAGMILLGVAAGSFELSEIRAMDEPFTEHAMYLPVLILFLLGAFTKSAQFPFHFWLPNAMAAPTPVSAYLHSATMVKGGVYLLARMHPTLGATDVWTWTLILFGGFTAVFAMVMAVRQTDLKQALAYTTLMALGTLTLFLAAPVGYAITGMMTFLIVHSLYKAGMFLVVGIVDHETGTRDARLLGGLARAMPATTLAAALIGLSMAGLPPFVGFIGKEILYAGGLEMPGAMLVLGAALTANILLFATAGIVAFKPFWRPAGGELPKSPHEGPWPMLAGPLILAALGLGFGLMPVFIAEPLVAPGVEAVLGREGTVAELTLWHGVNLPLILSLVTFAGGLLVYLAHQRIRAMLAAAEARALDFDAGWDRFLDGLKAVAGWQTRILQSGYLTSYLMWIFATMSVTLLVTIGLRGGIDRVPVFPMLDVTHWIVIALVIAGSAVAVFSISRIAAIAGLGVVGIAVALVFVLYGAPDVAITQLLVEMLIVVLFAVAALHLPLLPSEGFRKLHALVAVVVGGLTTALLMMASDGPIDRRLTDYFEIASWPEAFGRNIVNVILVDFRALDTFGEIAVVVIAALGAYALLKGAPDKEES